MDNDTARWIPARIVPPERPLGPLALVRTFVRNPIQAIPRQVYEEDFVPVARVSADQVWLSSPAIIKDVLLDQRDKFRKLMQIRLLGPLLGKGILTSEGAEWKWQRQASAPMFKPKDLAGFVPTFVRAAEDTVTRWRASPVGSVHSIEDDATRVTFDVIAATLLPSANARFAEAVQDSVRSFQRFGGWDLLFAALSLPRWLPRPGKRSGPRVVHALRSTVGDLARARLQSQAQPDDLMSRLIAARDPETGRGMDHEQLVDNLLTFYLAGHETTAKALTWTLYLLARSPGWTEALEAEIEQVTGGAAVTAEHAGRLALVGQVIKEAMRLYPPVPMMSRQAVADATIDGHHVRAGTSIIMPIYAIQRHVRRWQRPDEFDPTRFAPENEAAIPRYQYMPFGAGPRVCIGMSFAMLESTAILATFLQRARFEWAGGADPVPVARVTLTPKGGMPLRVRLK